MNTIDSMAYRSGWRDTAPALKALLAVATLVVCVACASPLCHLLVFLSMSGLTLARGKTPAAFYGKMLLLPAAFLLLGSLGIAVSAGRMLPGPYPYLQLGRVYLFLPPGGVGLAAGLAVKSLGAVSCLYFLILSTPVRDITALLARLHVPGILVEQMMLVYRFIFLLAGTASTKLKSARCRHAFRSPRRWAGDVGTLWGAVFVQSLDSGSHVYNAMRARGYSTAGQVLLPEEPTRLRKKDVSLLVLVELALIALNFI